MPERGSSVKTAKFAGSKAVAMCKGKKLDYVLGSFQPFECNNNNNNKILGWEREKEDGSRKKREA